MQQVESLVQLHQKPTILCKRAFREALSLSVVNICVGSTFLAAGMIRRMLLLLEEKSDFFIIICMVFLSALQVSHAFSQWNIKKIEEARDLMEHVKSLIKPAKCRETGGADNTEGMFQITGAFQLKHVFAEPFTDFNLRVGEGERVAVIVDSEEDAITLTTLIMGIRGVDSGNVRFQGFELDDQ